jgi:hypothetical protein
MLPNDDIENQELIHKLIRNEILIEVYPLLENDIPITISEINQIINTFKTKKKTPGFDQLNNEIIKNIHKVNPNLFVKLFNKCLVF